MAAARFSARLECAAACDSGSSSTGCCGGAVVTAAGGAAGDPSEAAGAVRIFTGELRSGDSSDITTNRFGAAA